MTSYLYSSWVLPGWVEEWLTFESGAAVFEIQFFYSTAAISTIQMLNVIIAVTETETEFSVSLAVFNNEMMHNVKVVVIDYCNECNEVVVLKYY